MITAFTAEADIQAAISSGTASWIFKHSATCPVSSAAHDEIAGWMERHPEAHLGMVVVQNQRPLSNWIAQRLGKVHQSPQLFLVQSDTVRWAASHWSITAAAMETAWAAAHAGGKTP